MSSKQQNTKHQALYGPTPYLFLYSSHSCPYFFFIKCSSIGIDLHLKSINRYNGTENAIQNDTQDDADVDSNDADIEDTANDDVEETADEVDRIGGMDMGDVANMA
jgi:3-methyladenine DNA glycosylase Mpg